MKVLITGAAGFLGRRLTRALADRGRLTGKDGSEPEIEEILLLDITPPPVPEETAVGVRPMVADLADAEALREILAEGIDAVFHMAAIVSGAAEADFDLGMRINLQGSLNLLEACRAAGNCPRLVFTSSIAVYGGETTITDETPATPFNSYGSQKAAVELMISEYSRKGFIDGRGLRLPTIAIRPGKPNAARSSFVSAIVREPLNGETAVCPVRPDSIMPVLSPRRAVQALIHAQSIPPERLGLRRVLLMGGLAPTMAEMVAELRHLAGNDVADRIEWELDEDLQRLVDSWPRRLEASRAAGLGFEWDKAVEDIISQHINDELEGAR